MKNHALNIIRSFSLIYILCVFILNSAAAQNVDTTRLPSLGNHVFTTITGVEDPFINTKFLLFVGTADLVHTEIAVNIHDDTTINYSPDLFFMIGGIEYQHAVTDWAAIRIKAGGLARIGGDLLSVLQQGISTATFFGIGWQFNFVETDILSFSGVADLNNSSLTYIDLRDYSDISSDSSADQKVINDYQILSVNTQLKFAIKLSRVFGFITNTSLSFGEIYARNSKNNFNWYVGSVFSIDLRNWLEIPFGLGLGSTIVSSDWQFSETNDPVYTANLNVSFINQNDFSMGVENYLKILEDTDYDSILNFHFTRIYLNYYF